MSARRGREGVAAAAAYAALAIAFTWPLARGVGHDIPGDFGDPLLNSWILAWDATHLAAGWRAWWNANIFHPHALALAYSEHLTAEALQILPVFWLTKNAILCYNLLFLSTFVLSGLGMFLLVRELTGDRAASFVAGLAFAFAPYRVASLPHLQVLSSAWMPFTLFGFRRFFAARRTAPLVGASVAWLLQNLSCGYYLLFFAPVVALYLVWEVSTRGLWRDSRALGPLAIACAVVAASTMPFLLPYLELRRLGFSPRSLVETQKFSADVYGYFTADPNLRLWGSIARAWPKAEGALFPGVTIAILAGWAALKGWSRFFSVLSAVAFVVVLTLALGFSIRLPGLKITSLGRAVVTIAAAWTLLVIASRDARQRVIAWLSSPAGFFAVVTLVAIVMSFGPEIRARDRVVLDTNLYALFYRWVPGFDGLRAPARFGMIVALGLSTLAGLALARIDRRGLRAPAIAGALIAIESWAAPIPINQNSTEYARSGLAPLPILERQPPPVYAFLATLPPGSAVVELPLGEPAFDVRYMFRSTMHWKPLVNGYTGGRPDDYELLDARLQDLFTRPEPAWSALHQTGATHAIVHEAFYLDGRGALVSDWLRANGAREIGAYDSDRVFRLP